MENQQSLSGKVLVGIAGWSYPDWKGLVFPRETNFNRLNYLSQFFDTLEVNTSFYSIPSRVLVQRWLVSVSPNPEFLFTVKLYKQFTHGEEVEKGRPCIVPSVAEAFKAAFEPLLQAHRLGALLLQFPYRFHDEPGNRAYLRELFGVFREFPLALEVRHRSFNVEDFYAFLAKEEVAFANIDQPTVSSSMPPTQVVTLPQLAYLRFHGRNATAWFAAEAGRDQRYDYDYAVEEFESYFGMIKRFMRHEGKLYVIFNNHYRASEVKNALEFLSRLTGNRVRVMPKLLKAYPALRAIALPEELLPHDIQSGENYRLF
jgi:uncharacterized protein YecE (DUF72 family)